MAWNDSGKEQYILPANVPANEFLNFEGQKFSKSRGWGIDVQDFLKFFPADTIRYALAVNLPEKSDRDFYLKDFQARINNELADIVGNFINRTIAFTEKNFEGKVPSPCTLNLLDAEMISKIKKIPGMVGLSYEQYRFRDGLMETMNLARSANKYFNDSEPWKTKKSNPEQCAATLYVSLQVVRTLAILLAPVIPFTADKIWKLLKMDSVLYQDGWDSAADILLEPGHILDRPEILIQKIEDKRIEEIIKFLEDGSEKTPKPEAAPIKPVITIDDFSKLDLRIAKVLQAEKVPKSEKLLKLRVELGSEQRQILAGIAKKYEPEDLIGKSVVIVANLQPAKLMGQESQGMILAASDANGDMKLIEPNGEMPAGSIVK